MRYTTIVKYVRVHGDGFVPDKLVPFRVSTFYGQHHRRILDWPELFGNHTSWVAEQVEQSQARYTTRAPQKAA